LALSNHKLILTPPQSLQSALEFERRAKDAALAEAEAKGQKLAAAESAGRVREGEVASLQATVAAHSATIQARLVNLIAMSMSCLPDAPLRITHQSFETSKCADPPPSPRV
jgi:hypothetical protein